MRYVSPYLLSFILGTILTPSSFADSHSMAHEPQVAAALDVLDAWIAATTSSREQPGLSIGIVYDQQLIWAKGYGMADLANKVPATPSTAYRIASISKLFTSTAILQLRDAGKLQLDDPVAEHLSWFQYKRHRADGPTVTIRHLLTHTSGLPREATGVSWNELTFPKREEMIKQLSQQAAVFPAETEWKYSNLALSIAGEVVAAVSGESWSEYVETHILKPLKMADTRTVPEADMPGLAVGYGRRVPGQPREEEPFVDIQAERPAGNLASTVEDLAKFVSLQFRDGSASGSQVLKGSTLREMHRVHWLQDDWSSGWGLGFSVRRVDDQVRIGHGGSLPGHRTQLEIAPAEKFGVIALTNANDGEPGRYVDQAFKIVGPAIAQAAAESESTSDPDPAWQKYVGTYTWKHADVQVMILSGKLTLIVPENENPWEARITLEPAGEHTFRAVPTQSSYSLNGELLTFELDENGHVTRFGRPSFYWLRK